MAARTPPPSTVHRRARRRRVDPVRLALLLALTLLIDGAGIALVGWALQSTTTPAAQQAAKRPVRLTLIDLPKRERPEEEEPEEEDKEPEFTGQIVEIAPPEVQEVPDEADYLSEYNSVVPEETRTEKFKINPEILAPQFAREAKLQSEDVMDLNIDQPSTGARVGNERFEPDRDGTLAALPSPWRVTNKEGIQAPTVSSSTEAALAGAPQNDLLDERVSDRVALNSREYLYAGYIKRIRRLVNFYWEQNLDNLPRSVRLAKSRYHTTVHVILDGDGALERIEVVKDSGSEPLDEAVVSAFKLAGPFPNPPEGLIAKDGRVYLPEMGFDVQLGVARAQYQGVDPRAGVQFPGIMKSPR